MIGTMSSATRSQFPYILVKQGQMAESEKARDFEESIFFTMLSIVNLTAQPFSRVYQRKFDITLNEWRVIRIIHNWPDITQHAIAYHVGIDQMMISRIVNRLLMKRRIIRRVNPRKRREHLIQLSAQGQKLYAMIAQASKEREELLVATLSPRKRIELRKLCGEVLRNARLMVPMENSHVRN